MTEEYMDRWNDYLFIDQFIFFNIKFDLVYR